MFVIRRLQGGLPFSVSGEGMNGKRLTSWMVKAAIQHSRNDFFLLVHIIFLVIFCFLADHRLHTLVGSCDVPLHCTAAIGASACPSLDSVTTGCSLPLGNPPENHALVPVAHAIASIFQNLKMVLLGTLKHFFHANQNRRERGFHSMLCSRTTTNQEQVAKGQPQEREAREGVEYRHTL